MKGLRVPKEKGERVRKKILELEGLDTEYQIKKTNGHLIFPLKNNFEINSFLDKFEIVEFNPNKVRKSPRNYREVLKSDSDLKIPKNLWDKLPSSYDLIGDIAVIDCQEDLKKYEKTIGEALIRAHSNINTVLSQRGPVSGEYRVRDLVVVAGEGRTDTIHKEHGIELKMDLDEVYFTPRLSTERWRVTQESRGAERVIDMFAGVGPFSIMIAKHNSIEYNLERIESIEINSKAYSYLKENIKRNNVDDYIKPHLGDAQNIIKNLESADRIIMNLPWESLGFLNKALSKINQGGIIHFYTFTNDVNRTKQEIVKKISNHGLDKKIKFTNIKKLRSYSTEINNYVLDIKVN